MHTIFAHSRIDNFAKMAKIASKIANSSTQFDYKDLESTPWDLYVSTISTKVPRTSTPHSHPEGQLIWALKGTLYLKTENKEWIVTPHLAIWVPPHLVHSAYSLKPLEIRTVYVKEKVAMGKIGSSEEKCLFMSSLLHELILYGAQFSYNRPPKPCETATCNLLLHLIGEIEEEKCYLPCLKDIRLVRCREILIKNLDQNFTLEDLAKKGSVSKRTLSRLIHDELHISFSDWKNSIKILHSIPILLEKKNVTEAAYGLGFDSPNSFIRAFKRIKGVTPKKYLAEYSPSSGPNFEVGSESDFSIIKVKSQQ